MQGSLARRLRILRAEKGWTMREAGRLLNLRAATLSDIEHGRTTPHDVTLHKIAQGYGVPVSELLGEMIDEREASPKVSPAGKTEGPSGAGRLSQDEVIADVGDLLERLNSPTRHLGEADLSRKLEDAPLGRVLRVSREARKEGRLLVPEIRRLLTDAEEGSPEYIRVMRLWADAATRLHGLRWLIRAKRGVKIEEVQLGVPGRDQGQDPDLIPDAPSIEMEELREIVGELEAVPG